jgi:hypothetical protein
MTEVTTLRVSKTTAETLEALRQKLNAESLDETIQILIKKNRGAILDNAFGIARGKINPFTEEERDEGQNLG